MRLVQLIIVLFCFSFSASSQNEWKDSLNVARKLYNQGKFKEALKYYKSADKLKPNDVDLSQEMAQAEYHAEEFEKAAKDYEQAASSAKTNKQKSSVLTNSGSAKMKQKDFAGAEDNFKEALRQNPNNEKARQQLVEAKRARKKQEEEQNKQNQKKPDPGQEDPKEGDEQNKGQNQQQKNQGNQQKNQGKSKPGDQQNQGDKQNENKSDKGKLGDKQTDRKLDELTRQEMGTKRRIEGSKGNGSGTAKKNW
jgi:Ca-activated chloride channel homolog